MAAETEAAKQLPNQIKAAGAIVTRVSAVLFVTSQLLSHAQAAVFVVYSIGGDSGSGLVVHWQQLVHLQATHSCPAAVY